MRATLSRFLRALRVALRPAEFSGPRGAGQIRVEALKRAEREARGEIFPWA
jgi:hypothetical protein